jgi:hypothetical protein
MISAVRLRRPDDLKAELTITIAPHESIPGMTPDQQVALASVVSSGVVAVVAVVATTVTAYLDRAARRKEAQTSRQQDRLERTYIELATYVHRKRLQADAVRPLMTFKDQPTPEAVTQAEIDRARSLAMTIASDEVRGILDEFSTALGEITDADATILGMERESAQTGRDIDPQAWGGSEDDQRRRIDDAKQVVRDIDDRRLHEQTRHELG